MLAVDEIRFDGWTLHRRAGELVCDGRSIRLQSQPLRILEELLAHPGELVTREELIAKLWPQGVVDFDTALNSAMRRLRTALDDHAETPRYIETIPRRGYRFVGKLDAPQAAAAAISPPAVSHRPWLLAAMALLVAAAIAFSLGLDPRSTGASQDSANPQAQELYLRAGHFLQRRGQGDLERARRYFEDSLALDPEFAEAWSGLASAYWISTAEGELPSDAGLTRVREAAEQAIKLDATLAEAHVRLANYWRASGDPRRADGHLQTAMTLEPDSALVLGMYASLIAAEGRFAEAAAAQRRGLEIDPLSHASRYNLAVFLYYAGQVAEAEQELIKLRELNPAPQRSPEMHGILLLTSGRYEEALALIADWPDGPDRYFVSAIALDRLGRRAEAEDALRRLVESGGVSERFRIAEVYAERGDADRAFEWLQAGEAQLRGNWRGATRRPLWMLEHSPFLRPLQEDARWEPWYAAAQRPRRQAAAGQH